MPSIGREQRIRQRKTFQAIHRHHLSRAHPLVVLRLAPNLLPYPRFGFNVGRRVARKAVVRNRIRRRIREAVRKSPVRGGWDLLFIARAGAAQASFQELQSAVLDLEGRAQVLVLDQDSAGPRGVDKAPGAA